MNKLHTFQVHKMGRSFEVVAQKAVDKNYRLYLREGPNLVSWGNVTQGRSWKSLALVEQFLKDEGYAPRQMA